MKTLKQHLDQIQDETEEIYWNPDSIIYAVKQWLNQHTPNNQRCDNSDCPECYTKEIETELINELKEALQ